MSLPTSIHPFLITGNDANQYKIANSLRFRGSNSAYLTKAAVSSPTNNLKWTWSAWIKRGTIGTTQGLFDAYNNGSNFSTLMWDNGNTLLFYNIVGGVDSSVSSTPLYRDVSAWYHVMLIYDSANATQADRAILYVNGSRPAQTNPAGAFALNETTFLNNSSYGMNIGRRVDGNVYFDGYMAEVNFIDGQALTPSSFGQTDSLTNQWVPKRYTGTYGTNGFYLPFNTSVTSSFSATFNGSSQYLLTATNAGLGLGTSDFTIEYWMNTTVAQNGATLCCAGTGTVSYDGLFGYTASSQLQLYLSSTGGSWDIASARVVISSITTGRWYHIAYTRSGSTWRVFVDGTQVDTFTSSASLYQSGNQFSLARGQGTGYFNGLLSNVRVIKGTALYTSNFSPSTSPLTAVTNTQLLTLQDATIIDNSTNALSITNTGSVTTSSSIVPWTNFIAGRDYSTNQFGWLSTNINATTSGVTYDVMRDSPTAYDDGGNGRGNYAVLNPINAGMGTTIIDGNLTFTGVTNTNEGYVLSTTGVDTGSFYFEVQFSSITGVVEVYISNRLGITAGYRSDGSKDVDGTNSAYGASWTTSNIIGCAFNAGTKTVTFYKDNISQGSFTYTSSGLVYPGIVVRGVASGNGSVNFGQRPFSYTPPAGFKALNSYNLPNPSLPLV